MDISDPYVAENVNNDAGERDLITLYASTIENEAALGKLSSSVFASVGTKS